MSRLPLAGLAALLALAHLAAAPGSVLLSQEYEYYVLGSQAGSVGLAPVCHVGMYREDPVSLGGACLGVPSAATEVRIRIQNGGLQATHAHYTFHDGSGAALAEGDLCGIAFVPVPSGAVGVLVALQALSLDCPDPRPASFGYVGIDHYGPG